MNALIEWHNRFLDRFIPARSKEDPGELSRYRLLVGVLVYAALFSVLAGTARYLLAGWAHSTLAAFAGMALRTSLLIVLWQTGSRGFTSDLLVTVSLTNFLITAGFDGGVGSRSLFWLSAHPLVANFTGGRIRALRTCILATVGVLALYAVQSAGLLETPPSPGSDVGWVIVCLLSVWFSGLVASLYEATRRRADATVSATLVALQDQTNQLNALFESMSEGIALRDADGKIILSNRAAREVAGLGPMWADGKTAREMGLRFFAPDGVKLSDDEVYWAVALKTGLPQLDVSLRVQRADGSIYSIVANAIPLSSQRDGGRRQVLTTFTDRTEFLRARDQAESATRAKSEFLSTMSHEIRTPLNAILGMTRLTLNTELTEAQRQNLVIVKLSADALLTIISDILDFSKIEAGKLELEEVEFDLADLLQRARKVLQLSAQEKGLAFTTACAEEIPRSLKGDPSRLMQVLLNLMNNAIKFTQAGSVSARIELLRCDQQQASIRCEIRDTGIGIDSAARERLFTPFSQADQSTTRRFGGTGLGLSISKKLIEMMGGSIGVESQPGQGSTFWFELPLPLVRPLVPERTTDGTGAAQPAPQRGAHVGKLLLVEDNAFNQLVAQRALEYYGYSVDVAEDGTRALSALEQRSYDLVIMDCQMRVMDGYETARRIRASQTLSSAPTIPIIAVTASASAEDRERCLSAGMNDYMAKPLNFEALVVMIDACLRPRE